MSTLKPFPCPSCQKLLSIPSFYSRIPGIGALIVCGAAGYLFGLRGMALLIFVILFWFPVTACLFAVLVLKFNPSITEYHSSLTK